MNIYQYSMIIKLLNILKFKALMLLIGISVNLISVSALFCQNEVIILSYHNVYVQKGKPGPYFISDKLFESHLKYFKENGYQSVLPEDIFNHVQGTKTLNSKSIMFSFDDTRKEHYSIVGPLLEKYGFKGAFFIMTVAIGKKNYMNKSEIRSLSDKGHCIALHTYDHQDLRTLPADQWKKQIDDPKKKLEEIIGVNVCYLAYPFGACNLYAAETLSKKGIYAAFQLAGKKYEKYPFHFIRRLMVSGTWSAERLNKEIRSFFKTI
jgi:peptidoglycan/xylan/chitin deacetylase (PgdA/CDA1 family)